MAGQLLPITVAAPSYKGLNKQSSAGTLGIDWATEAINCIIDKDGRIGARKGWSQTTTTPLTNTPDIEQIFEYKDSSGTNIIISAANNKLYSGTLTLTEITGSLTITDNNWKFQNLNGNVVGFQAGHEPIFWDGTGNFETLQSQITDWAASTAYAIGDVVKATSGNTTIYFHCTTAGTSDGSEPSWNTTAGATTTDNTATWTTRTFPNGNECLATGGRLWVTDSTNTVIHYSDLLIPYKFTSGSNQLTIDMKSVWTGGMDEITVLEEFNAFLVIMGKKSIVIYRGADNVSNLALEDQVVGTGCIARDSFQAIGPFVVFLSETGLRTLARTIQEKSLPLGDLSVNVRDYMRSFYEDEPPENVRSVYHELEGFYLINFPTSNQTFCFDVRGKNDDGSLKVTTWRDINPKAMCSSSDGNLYLGQAGVIGKYDTYLDNADTYDLIYRTGWSDLTQGMNAQMAGQVASRLKIPKKMKLVILGGIGYTITYKWAFDFIPNQYSSTAAVATNSSAAEYNVAEYNNAEYAGGDILSTSQTQMTRSGKIIQLGFDVTINGSNISFQQINMQAKLGRIAL